MRFAWQGRTDGASWIPGLSLLWARGWKMFMLCILLASAPLAAETRVALVIGNSAYADAGRLRNPAHDARAVAARLEDLGFDVIVREDLRSADIGRTLGAFRERLKPGAVALFYYAGHGLQIDGRNYLPAVDARIDVEEDAPQQSLEVARVLETMAAAGSGLKLVFLDACRNNPYAGRTRGASRGLAPVNAPGGTLIQYATRPGAVADDGAGRHGVFTAAFLAEVGAAGVPVEQMLKRIARRVKTESAGRQEPWFEGNIDGDFYFGGTGDTRGGQTAAVARPANAPLAAQAQVPGTTGLTRPAGDSGSLRDCDACPLMQSLPAGTFRMGDLTGHGRPDEAPVREIAIARPFAIAKFELSRAEWRSMMGKPAPGEEASCADCAASQLNWNDAQAFVAALSKKTGQHYRLPSEAEWEYACRAGRADTMFCGGNDIESLAVRAYGTSTARGTRLPNAWGVHDMSGGVAEWVQDCYEPAYDRGQPTDGRAHERSDACQYRVLRGDRIDEGNGRGRHVSARTAQSRGYRDFRTGLRVARDLP